MRRRYAVIVLAALAVLGCRLAWVYRSNYEIDPNVCREELNPLDGVTFEIEADRVGGVLRIHNQSDHYIVLDLDSVPFHVEVLQEDGWHRVQFSKSLHRGAMAISEHEPVDSYSYNIDWVDFSWNELIDGRLKPGTYRMIVPFGDGRSQPGTYSMAQEFQID